MKKLSKKLLSVLLVIAMLVPTGSLMVQISAETEGDGILEFNGHYYKVFNESLTWYEAKDACEELGGHLITVNTAEENTFITNILKTSAEKYCYWTAIKYDYDLQSWIHYDGSSIEKYNWADNEPNDWEKMNEAFVHIYGKRFTGGIGIKEIGEWNDVRADGAAYAATIYALSQFGYICEWNSIANVPGRLSENAKAYIQQHVDFVDSNSYNNLMTNASFYNAFWQYEKVDKNFTAYASWEIIGDIGEFMLGNLDDFFLTDNPYDIILADVLASYVLNENTENACEKALEYVFKADSIYKDFLTLVKSSSEWDDSIDTNDLTLFAKTLFNKTEQSLINGVFFSPSTSDVKKDYPEMYETVKKLFSGVSETNLNKIFIGINNMSTITDYINTGADAVNGFMDAYQKYIIAKTLVTTESEVLGALLAACYQLENPFYQTALKTSIDSYIEVLDYDSAISAVANYMFESSAYNVYNVFKGSLTDLVYSGIASIFGVNVDVVKKVIIAYNVTYAFLDYFSGVGKESEMFFILNATAVLEKSLKDIVMNCGKNLINDNALDNATRFDAAYGLLQSVEQYAYSGLAKYISAMKKEFVFDYAIKSNLGGFVVKYNAMKELNKKRASADIAIETAVFFEGVWKNANCHTGNFDKSKLVSVKCPTDVFVYNENDVPVLSIVDNRIVTIAANIAAVVDGNEKIISIPCDREYDIKIVGTDKGIMDYSVYESTDFETVKYTGFLDVPLVKDCVYSGNLEISGDKTELDYSLSLECPHPDENYDGVCDFCSEDFTKSCSCNCHSNAFMQFLHKILCFLYRIFGMEQYRYCGCGKAHW